MGVSLDRFIRADITRSTRTVTRRGFGTVMIAAYILGWIDRVREFADADELLEDLVAAGYSEAAAARHPAYLAAVALKSQDPSVPRFKVGRRVGAPTQSIRFTPATPVEGEVFSITIAGVTFAVTAGVGPSVADIVTALALLMNADPDAIIASGVGSTVGAQNLGPAAFNGVIGAGSIAPARNLTITLNSHADWDASTIVVTGLGPAGQSISESFTVPDGGNTVLVGTKLFSKVLTVAIPAQSGTGGTLLMGVGVLFENADLDITATDGATHLDVAADVAGKWFAYTGVTANLAIEDRTAEPGTTLATDLAAIQAADADWFGLIIADAQSSAQITAAATWAETQVVFYAPHTMDSACLDDVETDVLSLLKAASRLRTKPFWSRRNHGAFPDAALLGKLFPLTVGSADYEFKQLSGIVPDDLSTAAFTRLVGTEESPTSGKNATVYIEAIPTGTNRGTSITVGGLTSGDEWADVVTGLDFTRSLLQELAFNLRISSPKVPFTDGGISSFEGSVENALRTVARPPYNILDPSSITVQATALADVSAADRQARYYDGVQFDSRVQGAIRAVRFRGTVRP